MNKFDPIKAEEILIEIGGIMDWYFGDGAWFLMQGTALGAYRDKGFVPTEKDIDLGVCIDKWQEDWLLHVFTKHLIINQYDLELYVKPFNFIRTIVAHKNGIKIDIVGFLKHENKRYAASPVQPEHVRKPYCIVHTASDLEPPYRTVKLFGRKFYVPNDIEKYLELEYGSDWKTPKEDHISQTRIYNFITKNKIKEYE